MTDTHKEDSRGTLIVTGSGRGIGAAVAKLAGGRGFRVVVNYARNAQAAADVARAIVSSGGSATVIQADISREGEVVRLFESAEREFGPITGLVNNAGITGGFARVESVTSAMLTQVFAVNVVGCDALRSRSREAHVHKKRRTGRRHREYFIACGADWRGGGMGTLCGVERCARYVYAWSCAGSCG